MKEKELKKLFHWIIMPNGQKIILNKVGRKIGFRGGKPIIWK